jgi:glycosyltransferase involved in cell wall biosynthesis
VEPVDLGPRSAPADDLLWLTVSRLNREKGIDLLLEAWALSSQRKTSRLRILGDGAERADLEALARRLGIADRVEFAGFVSDKVPHWQQASAFVMSSRFEGFPNALCEAMAAGLPSVSFDCPSGPRAILSDGINGLLVPAEDTRALAAALDRIAGDPALRDRLGREAVKILENLGLAGITDRWEGALRP